MLTQRARRENAVLNVVQADLFDPDASLVGNFDFSYTIGVVEHFADLAAVVREIARFGASNATVVTEIPNMAGLLGSLTKRWNRTVYDLHVPHDLKSLTRGHLDAGVIVERTGYLFSQNFNVLSSCFKSRANRGWSTYLWMSRLTKAIWYFEDRIGDLPHTAN